MRRFRSPVLLLVAALALLLRPGRAKEDTCPCIPLHPVHKMYGIFHFSLSTDSPVANFVAKNSTYRSSFEQLFKMFNTSLRLMEERRKNHSPDACNLNNANTWVSNAVTAARGRQLFKNPIDSSCPSRLGFSNHSISPEFNFLTESPFLTIQNVMNEIPTIFMAIPQMNARVNTFWSGFIQPIRDWKLESDAQHCQVEAASAYVVDRRLYLRAAVTNSLVDERKFYIQRQYISEWIKDDFSTSLKSCHPKVLTGEKKTDVFTTDAVGGAEEQSSTLLFRTSGKAGLDSHNSLMNTRSNPAISEALKNNEERVDLAGDSIATSNSAILALPLVMNLIPVAFLADLNTFGTIAYLIVTDVLFSIPFLVKGVELILVASRSSEATTAYYVGDMDLGEIEIWAASCSGDTHFRAMGIIFVMIALIFIAGGIALEIGSAKYMRRRRERSGSDIDGPFGKAIFDVTRSSLLGSGGVEEALERRYSTEIEDVFGSKNKRSSGGNGGNESRGGRGKGMRIRWPSMPARSYDPSDASARGGGVWRRRRRSGPRVGAEVSQSNASGQWSNGGDVEEGEQPWLSRQIGRIVERVMRGRRAEGNEFSVGVGEDGMTSAERAGRESGSSHYLGTYGELSLEESGNDVRLQQ